MATVSARDVLAQRLERDPAFRAEWERLALARQVAELVLRYRVEHGLTQTELAHRLEITQSAVARLESGEVNPTLETLQRLAHQLSIPIALQIQPPTAEQSTTEPPTALVVLADVRRKPSRTVDRPRTSAEPTRHHGGGAGGRGSLAAAAKPSKTSAVKYGPSVYGTKPEKAAVTTTGRTTGGKYHDTAAGSSQKASSGSQAPKKPSGGARSPKR
jgi:transcriptional regulator with XRE-family HTH domain